MHIKFQVNILCSSEIMRGDRQTDRPTDRPTLWNIGILANTKTTENATKVVARIFTIINELLQWLVVRLKRSYEWKRKSCTFYQGLPNFRYDSL